MPYWVKGYPYKNADKTSHKDTAVIHRFDTLKEAMFFKSQVAAGEILSWGDGENLTRQQMPHAGKGARI